MKLYLAGPFSWRTNLTDFARDLELSGIQITSSWLSEPTDVDTKLHEMTNAYWIEKATIDREDIDRADVLALFTIDPLGQPKRRGGRHWECGYAYGRGKEVVVVGPRENIFHYLPDVQHFETREDAKVYLVKRGAN